MTDVPHLPVLKDETIGLLEPRPGKRIIDGTFGFGGHSQALLVAGAEVLGLDLDAEAHAACRELAARFPLLHCRHMSFRDLDGAMASLGWQHADGILLDLGVSSRQLDDPAKGFSYRTDGPLDLRFDQQAGEPAWRLLDATAERDLATILFEFGEERHSRRLARAIKASGSPIRTTGELRATVETALPRGAKTMATLSRVFQALRIAVNQELVALANTLEQIPDCLNTGGRVVIIAYHSLEDRLVKRWLDREKRDCVCPPELPVCGCGHTRRLKPLTRGAVKASPAEQKENPRSRSARLRAAERLAH